MRGDFVKRLDDLIREELTVMGYDYREVVASIESSPGSEGAVVRLQPPYEDVIFDSPAPDVPDDTFAARVRRRLKVVLEAPSRPESPEP